MTAAPALVVALPAVGAGLTAVVRGRGRSWLGVLIALAVAAAWAPTLAAVLGGAPVTVRWEGPVGLEVALVADGLAAAMVTMTVVVMVGVALFAAVEDHRTPAGRHVAYWPLLFLLWLGLDVLFLAGDLLTTYLMLELIAVAGALLVTLRGDRAALLAGTRYFYAELVASTATLFGLGLLWASAGTVTYDGLGAALAGDVLGQVGLAVVTVGLLLKVPLAPLHFWLPAAHTAGPSAVSPVLSAVVVKAALAVVARLWFVAAPEVVTPAAAGLVGVLATVAILWGSLAALRATELKRLVAASTVAQLGLMLLLVPLVAAGAVDGWTGGLMLAVVHALAKAALLMAAAVVVEEADQPFVVSLRGSAARRPVATMAFGIAALSLVGLPPTGGFVGKWYLLVGAATTGRWWWAVVLVVATVLTVAYLLRFLRPAFAPPPAGVPTGRRDGRDWVALGLAASTLVVGLAPGPLWDLLRVGAPLGGG